jgi:hypothetical protein
MEPNEESTTPLSKPKIKNPKDDPAGKKPRSEKQMESFRNVMQKRAENIAKKKEEKLLESAKLLIQKHGNNNNNNNNNIETISSESESDDKKIKYIKKPRSGDASRLPDGKRSEKKKHKHPSRKTIIFESSSDSSSDSSSESETDSEPEFIIKSRSKKTKKPQKERIKRSENFQDAKHNHQSDQSSILNYSNFFV